MTPGAFLWTFLVLYGIRVVLRAFICTFNPRWPLVTTTTQVSYLLGLVLDIAVLVWVAVIVARVP